MPSVPCFHPAYIAGAKAEAVLVDEDPPLARPSHPRFPRFAHTRAMGYLIEEREGLMTAVHLYVQVAIQIFHLDLKR